MFVLPKANSRGVECLCVFTVFELLSHLPKNSRASRGRKFRFSVFFVFCGLKLLRACLKGPALAGYVGDAQLMPENSAKKSPGAPVVGHTSSTAGTFRKKFRKNSGKTPETLSEPFLEFPSRVRLGCPKPYNSRQLRLPEHFQNSLPPSTAGDVSFFESGSGEGLSELVMEFPAVLGVFLM